MEVISSKNYTNKRFINKMGHFIPSQFIPDYMDPLI